MAKFLAYLPKGRRPDSKWQMPLFSQKPAKTRLGKPRAKGPSLEEKRRKKDAAFRLCKQAYAVLKNQPGLLAERDVKGHLREIGRYIGLHKSGRLTYSAAQSAIGYATGLLGKAGVKYKL